MRRLRAPRWRPSRGRFVEAFLTAPSPGIIAADRAERALRQRAKPISTRSAPRCGSSTRRSSRHGFLLQLDCPDLALERHIVLPGPAARRLPRLRRAGRRRDQRGAAQRPARPRAAARVLGQLRGAARPRRAAATTSSRSSVRPNVGGFVLPFANPRHAHEYRVLEGIAARRRPDPGRRRDRHADQLRRAPGSRRRSDRARGRRRSAIRAACSPAPIAASTPPPAWAGSPRTWSGRSSRRCATARGSPRSGCSAIEALMQGARLTDGQSAFRLVGQSFPIVLRSLAHAQPGGSRAWGRALRAIGWAARTDQSDQELVVCATHGFRTGHHA